MIIYTNFSLDDYSNMSRLFYEGLGTESLIRIAWKEMMSVYQTWQGTFSGAFVTFWTLGAAYGNVKTARLMLFGVLILFFTALWLIAGMIVKFVFRDRNYVWEMFIYSTLIIVGIGSCSPAESLYWLTGACMYTIPFALSVYGAIMYLKYFQERKSGWLISAGVIGFLASGGVLQVTALVNAAYLLIFCKYVISRNWRWKDIIPFVMCLTGALINVCAPGNYLRHDVVTQEKINLIRIILYTLYSVLMRLVYLLQNGLLLAAMLVIVVGILMSKKQLVKCSWNPLWMGIIGFCTVLLSVFPVALGCNNVVKSDRSIFLIDLSLVIFLIVWMFYIAIWIRNRYGVNLKPDMKPWVYVAVSFGVLSNLATVSLSNIVVCEMITEQFDGTLSAFAKDQEYMISQIENSKERDIVVLTDGISTDLLLGIGLEPEADYWGNVAVASYYMVDSIVIETEEN
jgi:hypothetical protein